MALKTLKPRLQPLGKISKVKVLDTKAGATQRIRGDAWTAIRRSVLLRDQYTCASCGIVRSDNEIDHVIPLDQGGDAIDLGNLQTLCFACHKAKSSDEARIRARG